MKRRILGAALVAMLFGGASAVAATIKVVATTEDLESLAKEVGGDRVSTESLAKGLSGPAFR
jgi:ABC-type Zn uptake system ZnuABC Zn-binding protein ZnuA